MRPICVQHGTEMPASKTGYLVQVNDANGQPYQIWSGDRYTCPVGGESIVTSDYIDARTCWHRECRYYGQWFTDYSPAEPCEACGQPLGVEP